MTTELQAQRNVIRKSHKRVILYGSRFEKIEYERPYFFNLPALSRGSRSRRCATKRRADNLARLRSLVRRIVEGNHNQWGEVCKFITYTFAENVRDVSQALVLWREYQKRLRRVFNNPKYLAVIEFQKRGSVHFHVLYFNMPYTPKLKTKIQKNWGHGFTQVRAIRSTKALGSYITKYMTKNIDDRLLGRKAFFTSRGLIRPLQIRREERIDELTNSGIFEIETERTYESERLGIIKHKFGNIKNHANCTHSNTSRNR